MILDSRAPHPALSDHPEFAMMLAVTLERFHCTLAELRQDYWMSRAWRALTGDPELEGRVARIGMGNVLVTGTHFRRLTASARLRDELRLHVQERLMADTAHTPEQLDLSIQFTDTPVEVAEGCVRSLLAQTVAADARWADLTAYRGDLSPVIVPVALTAEAVVAA
jgi:hypothetical protein